MPWLGLLEERLILAHESAPENMKSIKVQLGKISHATMPHISNFWGHKFWSLYLFWNFSAWPNKPQAIFYQECKGRSKLQNWWSDSYLSSTTFRGWNKFRNIFCEYFQLQALTKHWKSKKLVFSICKVKWLAYFSFLSLWMKGFCQAWVESGRNIRTKPWLLAWWGEREDIQYVHPVKPS